MIKKSEINQQTITTEKSGETQIEETDKQNEQTMSWHSNDSIDVPAIYFKKYLVANGVQYIQVGQASHVQNNNERNLKETVRQAEQKFETDSKPIAMEPTNDDKPLKTLVCLESKTINQIPEKFKQYTKNLSTRFGVMFYDNKIIKQKIFEILSLLFCIKATHQLIRWPIPQSASGGRELPKTYNRSATNVYHARWQVRVLNHNYLCQK